jgi:putative hemolysin
MSMLYIYIAGIIVCIALSAFCSGAEMCYSSCSTLRLESLKDSGSKSAELALKIVENYDKALGAILIGNNLVNIAASSLASVALITAVGNDDYAWAVTATITVLVIIFGETVPKIVAKKNANSMALSYSHPVRSLMIVLSPVVWIVVKLIYLLTFWMKAPDTGDSSEEAVEELQSIIETAEDEDVLDEDQSELVQAAIDFSEISAYEAMTARVDVEAIDIEDSWEDILRIIEDSAHTRIPVYEGSIDNIIGILYLNHFLKALTDDGKVDIRSLLMPPCYVYKTAKLPAVLNQMKKAKQHLAVVSDEYGGTLGVLSMEDVLEQIVGDIWDESDEVEQEIVRRTDGEFEIDGDMVISDFLELVGIREENFDADSSTVGGWVMEMFGGYPKEGYSFDYADFTVTVLKMDDRRVDRVLIKTKKEDNEDKEDKKQ